MDKNKLKVLLDIGYEIKHCCHICVHGDFPSPKSDFGYCAENTYEHQKHSGDRHFLSIFRTGRCGFFQKKEYPELEEFERHLGL